MQRQWFASFGCEHLKNRSKRFGLSLALVIAAMGVQSGLAAQIGTQDKENLPVYSVKVEPKQLLVGDSAWLGVIGFKPETGKSYRLSPEPAPSPSPVAVSSAGASAGVTAPLGPTAESELSYGFLAHDGRQVDAQGNLQVPLFFGRKGDIKLPAFQIFEQGQPQSITPVAKTESTVVSVASSLDPNDPESGKQAPLRGPLSLGLPLWLLISLSLLFLAVLGGVGYGVYFWMKRKRPAPAPKPTAPPKPCDRVALESLAELERLELWKKGQFKAHYFRLSETLKRYLGDRYGIDALESTSDELFRALEKSGVLGESWLDQIEKTFVILDRVKFTDHVPEDQNEGKKLIDWSKKLVFETKKPDLTPAILQNTTPVVLKLIPLWVGLTSLLASPLGVQNVFAGSSRAEVPLDAYIETQKGLSALKREKLDEALHHFGNAQAQNPDLPELKFNEGVVQFQGGESDQAASRFASAAESAVRRNDADLAGSSFFNLGASQAKAGHYKEAAQAYARAIIAAKNSKDKELEMDARKNLELLEQQKKQQEQQKKQDKEQQGKDGDPKDQSGGGEGKDSKEKKDGKDDKDSKGGDQDQDKNNENKPGKYKDPSKGRQREFKSQKLSKEAADRVMSELSDREKELQAKLKKQQAAPKANEKDW